MKSPVSVKESKFALSLVREKAGDIVQDGDAGIKFINASNVLDPRLSIVSIFSFLWTDQNKTADR